MIRLLLATNSRDRGSTSRTLEAWTRLLPEHDVSVIASVGGEGTLEQALTASGVEVHKHAIRAFFRPGERARFLAEIARVALLIRRRGIQLVHVNEHEHYPVVGRAAYLARVPVVTHVRFRVDAPFAQWLFKAPYTPRRVFFTSRTQMADSADAIATAVPADRFRLVYNGLNFDAFGRGGSHRVRLRAEWHLEPATLAIGTASSISSRKRLDHFIRLIGALRAQGINARGFIAGQPYFAEDEEELRALQALRHSLGLEDSVTFLGYVEPAEQLYQAWDVTVSCSAYETFGMTMLEAMACGCPVVAYPGGSVAEVIGDVGVIVPDGDLAALTSAVAALCREPDYRSAQGSRVQERAQQFDVRRSVAQLAEEYRTVLGPGKAAARAHASGPGGASPMAAAAGAEQLRVLYLTMNPNRASTTVPTEGWFRTLVPGGLRPVLASKELGAFSQWARNHNIPAVQVSMPVPAEFSWVRLGRALWKLRRLVKAHGIQLIHSNEQDLYPVAQYLGRLCRLPVIVSVHFTIDRGFCHWAFRGARGPARILFVSPGSLEACRPGVEGIVPANRWRMLPNGLNLSHFAPDERRRLDFREAHGLASSLVIGVACALRPRKQLEHLFRAAAELQTPNVRVLVAGAAVDGDDLYAEQLLRDAKALLGDRLLVLGHLQELRGFYNGLDLFVNTSEEEACSISVLESLACGCPVVGYASRSVDTQILPDGGTIVPQDDVKALTETLDGCLADRERLWHARAGARRTAEERFDIGPISKLLWEEYIQVQRQFSSRTF